jgi:short subunit dehydrogenase-like uncharacterized protein
MSAREFDIVLFGATGFTGGLVAEYLANTSRQRPLRWALAGRNPDKLESVRSRLPKDAQSPEIILADSSDSTALVAMTRRTRVLITTVGPYGRYGEPVVRACSESGTDYVDLTGEPEFADAMHERYHALAERNRAKIVHACGFDSIPHDLGANFALHALRRRMTERERETASITIEGFVRTNGSISGGTWQSTLDIMANAPRRRERPKATNDGRRASQLPLRVSFRRDVGLWAIGAPLIDPEVVVHSAELLPEYGPDFRYGHYIAFKSGPQAAGFLAIMSSLFALAQVPPAKRALSKIKNAGEGPNAETRAKSYFRVLFIARGAGHEARAEVRGGDPGYGETSKILAEAALCLAFDRDRLPNHYGVVPSVAAMGDPLLDRLQSAGITFTEL